jgi:hypothetical protein
LTWAFVFPAAALILAGLLALVPRGPIIRADELAADRLRQALTGSGKTPLPSGEHLG